MVSKYFAAGFIQGLGENLKERQDYIRDMTQRKTDFLMQEGLKRRGKVMDARLQFQKATDFLTSRGMDEDKVIALLEENPDEVLRLTATSLKREQDGMTLSGEILNKAVEISSDYKPQAGSVTEALDLIIPIFNKSEYSTPEAKEKGIFAKLFGSPTEAIDRNVYGQKLLGEYTGADIAASMGSPMMKRGRMSGSVKTSYGALAEPLSASEANALRSQTIATYDSMLDNEITDLTRTITRLGPKNELTSDELDEIAAGVGITEYTDQNDLFIKVTDRNKTLSEISKEKDKFKRFERMVEEFGAGEAVSMSGGRTEIFAPKNGFSTATFDTIREYGKDVKETPAVEVEEDIVQVNIPTPPADAKPVTKDGVTVYFNAEGVPVFAQTEAGVLEDAEQVKLVAEKAGISFEGEQEEEVVTEEETRNDLNESGYDFGQGVVSGLNGIAGDIVGNVNRAFYGSIGGTLGVVDFLAGAFGVSTPEFLQASRDWTQEQWDEAGRLVREGLIKTEKDE